MGVNPYEADPKRVPKKDPYLSRSPHYGRYAPQTDDFAPATIDWHTVGESGSLPYWKKIIDKHCTPQNSLNVVGSRDAFAVGKVIIRIDRNNSEDSATERYAVLNANELVASRKAEEALKDLNVAVPIILFCGTIDGKNVVTETRIPGVSLEVAWKYLSDSQKQDFKLQCQRILQRIATIDEPPSAPSYVCQGLNTVSRPDIPDVERDILFSQKEAGEELCLVHNDMVRPNIIVDDGRVVGIMGWRQSGYFGHDRAQRVHRLLRIPERSHIFASGERSTHDQAWADLYDSLLSNQAGAQNHGQENGDLKVKTESPATSIERVPMSPTLQFGLSQVDGADDHPTPKKITDLKRGSISRASSIDRSSPSAPLNPSKLGPNARKSSSASTKKASTAKKVHPKKRKIDALESESVGDRRSHSPASSRASKGPGVKKFESVSAAGSPAPEGKKKKVGRKPTKKASKKFSTEVNGTGQQEEEEDQYDDSDVENPDEIFCICRRPDNHTWMIGCEGGCEDWFHGKCVNINQEDEELIDRYICPNCHAAGKGKTTWKPMCRLKECRKPARISKKLISKYCSDDHGREFMRRLAQRLASKPGPVVFDRIRAISNRDSRSVDGDGDSPMETNDEDEENDPPRIMPEDLGSKGGVLTVGDLKAVIMGVSSAEEFRRLGERLISPPPAVPSETKKEKEPENKDKEGFQDHSNVMGLDIHPPGVIYTTAEEAKLQKLRKRRDEYRSRGEMIAQRNRFLGLVRARAKTVLDRLKAKEPKGGWKDICGFDARMSWNEEELDEWAQTEAGRKAFEDDRLEPEPATALPTNGSTSDNDGDEKMQDASEGEGEENDDPEDAEFAELSRGVCIKKRCDRHKQWVRLVQQDIQFEEAMLKGDFETCQKEANAIVEGAVLRICSQQG
ncbi:putative PHD transcription factor [Talaromyces proteolyticus]|uniref:PHD transcription factor n=1 Tax=Talaromyces proteolyticus TaxID=1131652 RepID=A0AAD4PX54_9EURO|nr:putative PHD transcription factor [Talaromyces proteolyticus]KAH8692746.1 putative PHD transcription factor [Talaromyces proteolyticus]